MQWRLGAGGSCRKGNRVMRKRIVNCVCLSDCIRRKKNMACGQGRFLSVNGATCFLLLLLHPNFMRKTQHRFSEGPCCATVKIWIFSYSKQVKQLPSRYPSFSCAAHQVLWNFSLVLGNSLVSTFHVTIKQYQWLASARCNAAFVKDEIDDIGEVLSISTLECVWWFRHGCWQSLINDCLSLSLHDISV